MTAIIKPGNIDLHRAFTDYYKPRVSVQGYQSLKNMSRYIICWFESKGIPLEDASIQDAMEFRKSLYESVEGRKLSIGTIYNRLKMGRKLFGYLVKFEKRETNPFTDVKYPRLPDSISRNVLNEVQMSRLMKAMSDFDKAETSSKRLEQYRSHVAAILLYATGMRIAEAAGLEPQDVDVKRREVIIRNGKGGKSRIAFLTGYAADVLDYYMRYGRKVILSRKWRKNPKCLFGAEVAALMSSANKELAETCKRLEIPIITCHGFRHSLGTHLLLAGCDIRHIQSILGHDKLDSTQRYTRVDRNDLKCTLDRCHPRQLKEHRSIAV